MSVVQKLITAIKTDDLAAAQAVLASDPALASARIDSGLSVLMLAAYYRARQVRTLLEERSPGLDLFEAAALGRHLRIEHLLSTDPGQVNAVAVDGFSALGLASFFGHPEAVRVLLAYGAAVDQASRNPQQVMPLHSAVAGRHLVIARMLLENGAPVNVVQQDGFTPLHGAAQNGQAEMIDLLLEYGADPSADSAGGQSPADFARQEGHSALAERLEQLVS